MKKIKVIEAARITKNSELNNIKGGDICNLAQNYANCGNSGYVTCGAQSLNNGGYNVSNCGIINLYITCGGDMIKYSSGQNCGSVVYHNPQNCEGANLYSS